MPSVLSERESDACVDILDNAQAARDFSGGMSFEAFASDLRTSYAVIRCIEIVSEASRRLGAAFKARHPHIPWQDIADTGNLYRHAYHRVALDIVWKTVHQPLTEIAVVCRAELEADRSSSA